VPKNNLIAACIPQVRGKKLEGQEARRLESRKCYFPPAIYIVNVLPFQNISCENLSQIPELGHIPPELARADSYEYRQIIVKPYRIIYQAIESGVFIFGIIHGRRNVKILSQGLRSFSRMPQTLSHG